MTSYCFTGLCYKIINNKKYEFDYIKPMKMENNETYYGKKVKIVTAWEKDNKNKGYRNAKYLFIRTNLFSHANFGITAMVWNEKKHKHRWRYFANYQNIPCYRSISGYCMSKNAAMAKVDEFLKLRKLRLLTKSANRLINLI